MGLSNAIAFDSESEHRKRITRAFYIGVHEITQAEFEQIIGTNPSWFSPKGKYRDQMFGLDTSGFPVEYVSWDLAVEFCRRLSELEGREYRLPTEAEWEYACRAGTITPFSFGDVLDGRQANCNGYHPYGTDDSGTFLERPTTVGSYIPNAFGVYDMHGNVWEWCSDWYTSQHLAGSSKKDPTGPQAGSNRVCRGGGWPDRAADCRSAARGSMEPNSPRNYSGFRVVEAIVE